MNTSLLCLRRLGYANLATNCKISYIKGSHNKVVVSDADIRLKITYTFSLCGVQKEGYYLSRCSYDRRNK